MPDNNLPLRLRLLHYVRVLHLADQKIALRTRTALFLILFSNLALIMLSMHFAQNPKENNRVAGLFRILEFYLLVTCHDEGMGMNLTGWTKQSLCSFEMPVLFDYSTHHAKKVFYTGAFLAWELETIPEAREWLLAVPQVDKWATITSFIETSIASLPM